MKPLKVGLLCFIMIIGCLSSSCFGYIDDYPPFKFREKPPKHLAMKPLVSFEKSDYVSNDKKVVAKLKETADTLDFVLKDGDTVLVQMKEKDIPMPYAIYQVDLDQNGLQDFMIFYNYRGNGLAALRDKVDIFMKISGKKYQKISFDTMSLGLEDIVDLNNDGKYQVMITDTTADDKHTYFTYNIYEFKDSRLVNADFKHKGFPKFIWYTEKPNDKDTARLSEENKAIATKQKNEQIEYKEVNYSKN